MSTVLSLPELLKKFSLSEPIRREIAVEPKVLDEKQGIIRFTASDETLDCYNEIVRVSGWLFDFFAKNAPFVNSHRYQSITDLLGKVVAWKVEGGELIEDVQFALTAKGDTLADWAFAMYRDKFLRACSVGFVPVRMASKWDNDKSSLLAQIGELKLDSATAAKLAAVYIQQQQIELSGCVLGANPNALAKSIQAIAAAYKAGTIPEQAVQQICQRYADANPVTSPEDRGDGDVTRRRARLALLMKIQSALNRS